MINHTTMLTPREWDVLELVAQGLQYDEVATRLTISPHTVKAHARNFRLRLGASNAAHALYLVIQNTTCG